MKNRPRADPASGHGRERSRSAPRSGRFGFSYESGRERRRPYATPPKGGGHKALKNILPPLAGRGYYDRSAPRSGRTNITLIWYYFGIDMSASRDRARRYASAETRRGRLVHSLVDRLRRSDGGGNPTSGSGRERRRPYATPPKGGGRKALKNILPPRKGRGYSDRSAARSGHFLTESVDTVVSTYGVGYDGVGKIQRYIIWCNVIYNRVYKLNYTILYYTIQCTNVNTIHLRVH